MAPLVVKFVLVAALVAVASSAGVDHKGCRACVSNGFCYNHFYGEVQATFCPKCSGTCSVVGPAATPFALPTEDGTGTKGGGNIAGLK